MPKVTYGGENGQTIEFETSDDLLAVRTRGGRTLSSRALAPPQLAVMEDMELAFSFPEANVEVYRRTKGRSKTALENTKRELRQFADTRFAGRVLVQKGSQDPVVYTENLFVKFEDSCSENYCQDILNQIGLTVKRSLPYARNAFFVEAPEGTGQQVFDIAQTLLEREDVELAHPELVRQKELRTIFEPQWHLKKTTVNGQPVDAGTSVDAAHQLATGEGITIAVIDDGVDIDHEEFSSPGKIVAPRDTSFSVSDPRHANPRPRVGDNHGTACAGVACADGRFGASGVAPGARLMPIRNVSSLGSQAEADAFHWAADNGADVISCSWGPRDGRWFDPNDPLHNTFVPLPDSTRLAIEYAINNGRGGRGCVIFWAAGNGNESADNDGYAASPHVIAVAACNDRSRRSVYSDFGDAVFCSFPSSDFGWPAQGHPEPLTPGIWTTDRSGRDGYNHGDLQTGDLAGNYTNSFGGTSSACPGAAGVAALVLSRNPALRWDEVRRILGSSSDRIDPQGGNYDAASGHSAFYGHGRLNAEKAVRAAVADEPLENVIVAARFNAEINDFRRTSVRLQVGETRELSLLRVEVEIQHTYIGDLVVQLIPPEASGLDPVVLHNREGRGTHDIHRVYDAASVEELANFAGMSPAGDWTLQVEDFAHRDRGHVRYFGLELVPAAVPGDSPNRAVMTADIGDEAAERPAARRRRMAAKA
ncbi:MAG: S8 family serine peptidase [Planctomycetaceae bacterium]